MKGKNNPNFGHKWNKNQKKKHSNLMKKIMNKSEIKNYMKNHRPNTFGKNNPNYIDGRSKFPYPLEFTPELKESIRKRDNYECQNCGMTEEEHLIVLGKTLPIHHIDYCKQNCKEDNLITLCNQCNVRANKNRDYWYSYFICIMEKYKCLKNI